MPACLAQNRASENNRVHSLPVNMISSALKAPEPTSPGGRTAVCGPGKRYYCCCVPLGRTAVRDVGATCSNPDSSFCRALVAVCLRGKGAQPRHHPASTLHSASARPPSSRRAPPRKIATWTGMQSVATSKDGSRLFSLKLLRVVQLTQALIPSYDGHPQAERSQRVSIINHDTNQVARCTLQVLLLAHKQKGTTPKKQRNSEGAPSLRVPSVKNLFFFAS